MTKNHLIDSEEPLKEGQKQLANCGAIVPNAVFVFMWDEGTIDGSLLATLPISTCRKCRNLELEKRYVYGIRSGEEVKQEEAA